MLSGKIKRLKGEVSFEDIFLDKIAKKRAQDSLSSSMQIETPLKGTRFLFFYFLIFITLGPLAGFSFYLQIKQNDYYSALSKENKTISFYYGSERGLILDKNNKELVENEISFDLWATPAPQEETLRQAIAFFNQNEAITRQAIALVAEKEIDGSFLIKKNLSQMELVLYEAKKNELPLLSIRKRILRKYFQEGCFSHILGYLGKISQDELTAKNQDNFYNITDYLGKSGIESFYEKTLREQKGELRIERTAEGTELKRETVALPKSGENIILSLDIGLQKKAQKALSDIVSEIGSQKGVVVALDVKTGGILAFVSLPCYDNNLFAKGISLADFQKLNENPLLPQLNRGIAGLYPTGSVIKPFVGLGALEEGIIKETSSLYCPKELCVENQYNKNEATCFPDWTYHGWSDIKRAIAESVNPFFYIIAGGYTPPNVKSQYFVPQLPNKIKGLGALKLAQYLEMFGFSTTTGIDLPSEANGRVPTPDWKESYFTTKQDQQWYLGDTYNLSIGQGYLLATPMEVAKAFLTLVNDGKVITPRLIQGEPIVEGELPIKKENFRIIKEGMRQCVVAGSAARLGGLPFTSAAKTGTAQVHSKSDIYDNWLAVFAPYENPEILLVVLIEEVQGTRVAAQTIAEQILYYYFVQSRVK